jgi:flagellar protein FlaG
MIDSVSSNTITPIQQRPSIQDGEPFQQTKTKETTSSLNKKSISDLTSHAEENQSNKNDEKKRLEEIVKGLNEFLQPRHTSLKFQLHEKLNEYFCQVIDDKTKEVITEIPSKKLLDAYAIMAEQLGFIIDKKI